MVGEGRRALLTVAAVQATTDAEPNIHDTHGRLNIPRGLPHQARRNSDWMYPVTSGSRIDLPHQAGRNFDQRAECRVRRQTRAGWVVRHMQSYRSPGDPVWIHPPKRLFAHAIAPRPICIMASIRKGSRQNWRTLVWESATATSLFSLNIQTQVF